jgi:hypothetical protein
MGVDFSLVDEAGKRVLDCGKVYWLRSLDGEKITASHIRLAYDANPNARNRVEWFRDRIVAWCDWAGVPVLVVAEDTGEEFWFMEGASLDLKPGWEGWSVYDKGWTDSWYGWRWEDFR